MKTKPTIKIPRWIDHVLWKFGANKRKRLLKFFGLWTLEDEIFDILAEEIQNEIDKEILNTIKINVG